MSRTLPMITSGCSAALCSRFGPSVSSIGSTPAGLGLIGDQWVERFGEQPGRIERTHRFEAKLQQGHNSVSQSTFTIRWGSTGTSEVPSSCSTFRCAAARPVATLDGAAVVRGTSVTGMVAEASATCATGVVDVVDVASSELPHPAAVASNNDTPNAVRNLC